MPCFARRGALASMALSQYLQRYSQDLVSLRPRKNIQKKIDTPRGRGVRTKDDYFAARKGAQGMEDSLKGD
jgi:hypothetical protein